MADDISSKIEALERSRKKLRDQVSDASSVLDQVGEQIDSLTARREQRRVDALEKVPLAEKSGEDSSRAALQKEEASESKRAAPPSTTEDNKQAQPVPAREDTKQSQLVPGTLTAEQTNIKPGEKISDRPFLFSETIEHSQAAVSLKNGDGEYVYANATVHNFFGAAPGKMLATTDFDWSPAELAEQRRKNDIHVLDTGNRLEALELATVSDGTRKYWYSHKFPAQCNTGILIASVSFDVTDLVDSRGVEKAMDIARTRFDKMETLKQQLARLARQIKDKPQAAGADDGS